MEFSQPAYQLIQTRSSYRNFQPDPLPGELVAQFQAAAQAEHTGPFGNHPRFRVIAASPGDSQELKGLGTYGFIKGAPAFLVGAVAPGENELIDYGYIMEQLILKATDLGLQTCWLGGAFKRSRFGEKMDLTETERVPAVSPIGYATPKRRAVDRAIRLIAGSKKRKPAEELFFQSDGLSALPPEQQGHWAAPLEALRLAPSASNKQPWRIQMDSVGTHLYFVPTPGYSLPYLQQVDLGIAMAHFSQVALEQGLVGTWKNHPEAQSKSSLLGNYVASFL